ncbi:MAG: hypothetical protein A2Z68_01165 [Candidatus Nealsonbacteria bacterium RBG_13_38_11]|uniref:Uncharacterized protein n=1 Tax=Candidatus Nealsonbacteria bacterium RBG_13_38_11 TaxID=1801662 RepID=A0A1G2DYL7_9BACT|nr:MAG: hypothetical protein A2Z68_01165 [Candidatus Nealsonbacteria bacterium RBG_13_38_11]
MTSKHGLIYLKWQEVRPAEAESKGRVYWFFFLPFSLSLNRRFFVYPEFIEGACPEFIEGVE